ncbi:MAG: hypothetical protein JWM20_458 [Patescibacteria group bacterium]|nr:hypothetical protein [Patescibacteria group bacterium]
MKKEESLLDTIAQRCIDFDKKKSKEKREVPEKRKLTNLKIRELLGRIKPVVTHKKVTKEIVLPEDLLSDPRKASFIWDIEKGQQRTDLVILAKITTYHESGQASYFKPDLAEILEQIPEEYFKGCIAFEVGKHQQSDWYYDHMATTILYTKKK